MRGYSDNIVAALSEAEVNALRRVYETVRTEFGIPRKGRRVQRLANFLMAEFRRYPLDEDALLAAARTFCLRQEPASEARIGELS
ncbi:hypothetical protein ABIA24_006369 [Sinorhizobium fredii]|uniref:Uncharacterized protein n=2 Tax=Rhizobium fredii TaxID=380 RepID=A0A2A6M5F0_RHIFR|nr:hypothetical protein CO661_03865 [Sinorhizobium fredii]CCE99871.1 hypothetical protein SFHH103_05406 [Sinorhizobium fredii HH103]